MLCGPHATNEREWIQLDEGTTATRPLGVERKHFTISTPTHLTPWPGTAQSWLLAPCTAAHSNPHYLLISRAAPPRPAAQWPSFSDCDPRSAVHPCVLAYAAPVGAVPVSRLPTSHLASIFHLTQSPCTPPSLAAHDLCSIRQSCPPVPSSPQAVSRIPFPFLPLHCAGFRSFRTRGQPWWPGLLVLCTQPGNRLTAWLSSTGDLA